MGSMVFITVHNNLTWSVYGSKNERIKDLDFKSKNFIIYMGSEFAGSCTKLIFEARK